MTVKEYNKCVELYSDRIYRFVLKNIRDEDEAKDVVQDCFEKTWLKCDDIPFEKAKSYFFTAAYHTMIDRIRKQKRTISMESANMDFLHYDKQQSDLKSVLNKALDGLSEIQRSVVLLRDYEGYSYQEIADITKLTETQVKVYIFRARKALKEYLVKIDYVM